MASASAPARELAVQLSAPASSLAVPPPAASAAEAVDLSAEDAILEDPGPAATTYTWVQMLSCTRYCCTLHMSCVACFVLWNWMDCEHEYNYTTVSYTHLTLPTIYSV